MPGEPPMTSGGKSSGKIKRISIPRVQSSTDTELQSQSGSTPLQPTALHYGAFRTDPDDGVLPPALRCRLFELFQQIEKEFEALYTENLSLQEKIDTLNERLERECYGSGERNLPIGDVADFSDTKGLSKQKSMAGNTAQKTKTTSHKLKVQTSKIVSSFKTPTMSCSMQREYIGHRDGVWEVSVGRSGQIIATASADHTAKVWAVDSGRCLLQYIGHSGSVNSVRFHPTKELALTSSGDDSAHVWQAAVDWDLPKRQNSAEDLSGLSSERNLSGVVPMNEEQEEPPTLRTPVRELLGHTGVVMAADWLPDVEQVVTASWDRTANLYDVETGEIIHTLCGHDQELSHVSTHHTQRLCVTSSKDSTFRLWDFREPIHSVSVFQAHTDRTVTSAVFTREDKIVSGSDDRSVKVWELRNIRSPLAVIRGDSAANRLAVSSSGTVAIPHDNRQIRLFDLNGQRLARLPRTSRQGHRRMVSSVAWAEDSGVCNLFSCGFDRLVLGWSIVPLKEC
ncbi:WD repeat-containing protein 37 isoform X3 [Ceratina calcarata]|uniref:WD repeat-containing protein 37 n=1 Tax=Ceratina calcarata TaxID=156304 RepID=A0AAJ7J664_9HYME|nr:WD repeat-containing protein 37 isoform X3 [Ceratina calcarata]